MRSSNSSVRPAPVKLGISTLPDKLVSLNSITHSAFGTVFDKSSSCPFLTIDNIFSPPSLITSSLTDKILNSPSFSPMIPKTSLLFAIDNSDSSLLVTFINEAGRYSPSTFLKAIKTSLSSVRIAFAKSRRFMRSTSDKSSKIKLFESITALKSGNT